MDAFHMPGLDKAPPIVVQSNRLIESRYSLTLGEQRLILAMISLIHPDDQDFKPYVLKTQDLAMYLNVGIKNAYRETDKITNRLMERVLHIPQPNGDLLKVHWVSSALHSKGKVELSFNPKLKPYLIQLKQQFTQFQLTVIAQFQSAYTVRIYSLLKQYEKIGCREIALDELREILGLTSGEYSEFKRFRQWVLNQAKKEFEKKMKDGTFQSDLSFELETIRTGRKITRLKFHIKKQAYQEALPIPTDAEPLPQIQKMMYFGISEKQAAQFLEEYGSEAIENALDVYAERLQSGQVKKQSGGYLARLIQDGVKAKSPYELEQVSQQHKAQEESLAKDAQEAATKAADKSYRDQLEAKFYALDETTQTAMMLDFESTLSSSAYQRYKKSGLNSPAVKGSFRSFLVTLDQQV